MVRLARVGPMAMAAFALAVIGGLLETRNSGGLITLVLCAAGAGVLAFRSRRNGQAAGSTLKDMVEATAGGTLGAALLLVVALAAQRPVSDTVAEMLVISAGMGGLLGSCLGAWIATFARAGETTDPGETAQ